MFADSSISNPLVGHHECGASGSNEEVAAFQEDLDRRRWRGYRTGHRLYLNVTGLGRSRSRVMITNAVAMMLAAVAIAGSVSAQSVSISERDAVLWSRTHEVSGSIKGSASGTVYHNDKPIPFDASGDRFSVQIDLDSGLNTVVACTESDSVCSDTLLWTLGYTIRPEVFAWAEVAGRNVTLMSEVLDNPSGELAFEWREDPDNPQPVTLSTLHGQTSQFTFPEGARPGEYYFDLITSASDSVVFRARTFVTIDSAAIRPFDIEADHAAWIDRAVLYEIAPWYFGRYWAGQQLRMITDKIPEIAALGVSAIWLQPITRSHWGGQAYDVTDYFRVWDELGVERDLSELVEAAHGHGLKVLLDIVPNHSSIHHPYARDAAQYGGGSYYFDFYQRLPDSAPYSNNYTQVRDGLMTFMTYFWPELVNLNYNSLKVERYITEASRYWIEEFDIDGYRFDAVWGVHARDPDFTREWRQSLKRIKPEILMLAEAKAPASQAYPDGFPSVFESFDAAYDWTDSAWCISYWSWAQECLYSAYEGGARRSLFNSVSESARSAALRSALTNRGNGFPERAKILRFMENNDVPRFRAHHSLQTTKMVAALLFSLPGIPMLYYGQESGITTQWPTFTPERTIRSYDKEGLWPYYEHLIQLRKTFSSLSSDNYREIVVSPSSTAGQSFAYHRWNGHGEHVVGYINMGSAAVVASLDLSNPDVNADPDSVYYLTDLLSGGFVETTGAGLAAVTVTLDGHSAALFVVANSVYDVTVPATIDDRPISSGTPARFHNYPNPFDAATTIEFDLDRAGEVRLTVHDLLGRKVAEPLNGHLSPGTHHVRFDGRHLPSGVYVYRLQAGERTATRIMVRAG